MNKYIRRIKSKINRGNQKQLHITDLPPEALARIFDLCSYDDLARRVRLVCKRFCDVATSVLNQGISNLGPKIDRAMADSVSRLEEGRSLEELLVKTDSISFAISDVVHRIGQGRSTEQQTLTLQHYMALMSMKFEVRERGKAESL
ncbi:hypothetical protein L798_02038 [Zootermopsis nevadensis]|uniref:F-box domain-containing protein n=1 Tax=Zootermopsis nevadensis TaxID=136037 RepID=A0A067QHW2_ZOONE|nr:hypothetical protein L798_02038 [Zootermopsis nevadensis]